MPKVTLLEVGAGYSAATDLNANNDTVEAAFDNTLSRDGTAPNYMEAQLDMNSYRIINLADGVNPQDAVTVSQLGTITGGGGIVSVGAGTGISVDTAVPTTPVVSLDAATQALLATLPSNLSGLQFVTFGAEAGLTGERVLTAGSGITLDTSVAGQVAIVNSAGTDHGALTGLADDDHPQYAAIAQAETITGAWSFGANVNVSDTFGLVVGHSVSSIGDAVEVVGTAAADASLAVGIFAASAVGAEIDLTKSRNASLAGHTIVQDNDVLGVIKAWGSNGTDYDAAAAIEFRINGTPGAATDMPGEIAFQTSSEATVTPTDRMTISAEGSVHITKESASASVPPLRIGASGATPIAADLIINTDSAKLVLVDDPLWLAQSGYVQLYMDGNSAFLDYEWGTSGSTGFFYINANGVNHILLNPTNDGATLLARPTQIKYWTPTTTVYAVASANNVSVNANVWLVTPNAGNTTITGVAAPSTPSGGATWSATMIVVNQSGTDSLVFSHDSASSTAANRFYLPGSASVTIGPYESAHFVYSPSASRWLLVSQTTP